MKRWWALLIGLCLFCMPCAAGATEGAYLTGEDLQKLEPAYEAFLQEAANVLIARGLLEEDGKEAWILYQLGDFVQNGGYGSFLITYSPGLGYAEDDTVTLRRFAIQTAAGTLSLETLRRYVVNYSPLPGVPLDTELLDANGEAVDCLFRWTASDGAFYVWDGAEESVVSMGKTYVNDGRALYWYADPIDGIEENLTLEVLSETDGSVLAMIAVVMRSGADAWTPEVVE